WVLVRCAPALTIGSIAWVIPARRRRWGFPRVGKLKTPVRLRAGMTLAIEPIVNAGSKRTRTLRDRWTVVTVDRSLSAQYEHTVLVTDTGYEILTDRTKV
ncbi:MAG: hypothetical protein AAGF24_01935, partial [Cyanobacteria bacterium P01_H01_bin.121]